MFTPDELHFIAKTLIARRNWINNNSFTGLEDKSHAQETLNTIEGLIKKINFLQENPSLTAEHVSAKQRRQHLRPEQIRVLVVDDDSVILSILEAILQSADIEKIDLAKDGLQAISMLKDANPVYDLVLCDMNMPFKNGLDVHKAMRTDERHANALFILITATAEAKQIHAAIKNGVNDYIVKPMEQKNLLGKIAKHFPNILTKAE